MQIEVGQEYIDKNGTIYKIDIIGNDSIVSYSLCDYSIIKPGVYYHAGSTHIVTFQKLVDSGALVPLTKASRALYGKST